jgi:hypothetical protein
LRQTRVGNVHAGWRMVGHRIEVLFLRDVTDPTPAYRLRQNGDTIPIPLGQCGFVEFDEYALPDLAQVREWFPRHGRLWDAVRAQFWEAWLPTSVPDPMDRPAARRPPG